MKSTRLYYIKWLYEILEDIENRVGGKRCLRECNGKMRWPRRGIYFFFEHGEERVHSGSGLRVVRVGTHALKPHSRSTLWERLRTHRGTRSGGNHRASVFRRHIGEAILKREGLEGKFPTWGKGSSASAEVRQKERQLEQEVSKYIGAMPFLWLEVDDPPGPNCLRTYLERNIIALLSNYRYPEGQKIDPPSRCWLGNYSPNEKIRRSGLWNDRHVDEEWDPGALEKLEKLVKRL